MAKAIKQSKSRKKRGPQKKSQRPNKRDREPNVGLSKGFFSRIKQEYHDYDYISKLSPEDAAWLSKFTEEDLGARFNHKGKKVYRKVADKRASYSRNNARNRDTHSIAKATGTLDDIDAYYAVADNDPIYDYENRLIDSLFGEEGEET